MFFDFPYIKIWFLVWDSGLQLIYKHRGNTQETISCRFTLTPLFWFRRLSRNWPTEYGNGGVRDVRASLGWHYLSKATCLMQASFNLCVFGRLRDHRSLSESSPLLRKTCVRQVVLDKLFPPESHNALKTWPPRRRWRRFEYNRFYTIALAKAIWIQSPWFSPPGRGAPRLLQEAVRGLYTVLPFTKGAYFLY